MTPLVDLMRSTPAEKLQPMLAEKLVKGETDLKKLIGGRRPGQCRDVRRLRLRRLPHGDGHAAGAGDEPHCCRATASRCRC